MPSLALPNSNSNSKKPKSASPKKEKKLRNLDSEEKRKKKRKNEEEEGVAVPAKKSKKVESEDDENGNVSDDRSDVVEEVVENPNALSKFRMSEALRTKLRSKGIEALFPIQAMTYDIILDGSDMVGRARTGQGKTLAFVLPILESLVNGQNKAVRRNGDRRSPSVLVLLPTRELAKQVHSDFVFCGEAVGLSACCLYGGSSFRDQEFALRRGVDIVIGTPGRIKDHLERETLDLKSLKFRVLDEADEMLKMGFVDDVELILKKVEDANKVQTLLFSATLPDWVKKISAKFLKPTKKTVDLVGNEKMKASASVRHLVLPCSPDARAQLIPDIIRCYSRGGRTIIFTETKDSASGVAGSLPGARALHGDIVQAQREVILAGFRSGRFYTLVATNVAARGLDINDVQLIIQCEPPRDVEDYIHRSGRTGRAGNTGVAILLYDPKYSRSISKIEKQSGFQFERIAAPQPADIAELAGSAAADAISEISDSVIPVFQSQAEHLLASSGLSAVDCLAKALAKAAGYTDIKKRSLLSAMENYATLLLRTGTSMYSPSYAFGILRKFLPDDKISGVKGLSLTADGKGAVFDVPASDVDLFLEGMKNTNVASINVAQEIPPLQERDDSRGNGRGGFGGRGGNSYGRRFGGGGGGRGHGRGVGRGQWSGRRH